jgi:hypothetical protein
MGSLFTNGGRIKDVIGHYLWINHRIFHKFQFAFFHFEHIYLIHGKIGHIKIWP